MSRGVTARLFVAIDPPAPVREELAIWARGAASGLGWRVAGRSGRPLRLLAPDLLHMTLCFLGERPVGEIEAIVAALGTCGAHVGPLSVGAPLWLPPRRPHALAVEIHEAGEDLVRLHEMVSRAISRATAWRRERRRFRAHVTVARMPSGSVPGRRGARGEGLSLPATPKLSFTPQAAVLYRSRLDPAGASYEPIATCRLLPSDP